MKTLLLVPLFAFAAFPALAQSSSPASSQAPASSQSSPSQTAPSDRTASTGTVAGQGSAKHNPYGDHAKTNGNITSGDPAGPSTSEGISDASNPHTAPTNTVPGSSHTSPQ